MEITIKAPEELGLLQKRLKDERGLLKSIAPVIDTENELTVAQIQEAHMSFSGPTSLGVRTGRLRRSVRPARARIVSGGVWSAIGSNVKYMGPHEFGIDADVSVKPHMRKHVVKKVLFGRRRKVRLGDISVRGYTMHMKQKERAPIRRGIEEREEYYRASVREVCLLFWTGKD
jgi:hypothetical protein